MRVKKSALPEAVRAYVGDAEVRCIVKPWPPVHVAPGVAMAAVVTVIAAYLASLDGGIYSALLKYVFLPAAVIAAAAAAYRYLEAQRTWYVVTDELVISLRSFIREDLTTCRIDRIQDVGVSRTLLERLLGVGDVRISTAGEADVEITFWDVRNPRRIANLIITLMRERGGE